MVQRSMFRVIESDQDEVWDRFVDGHGQGHFLQSGGWGRLKAGGGWHPLRVALWDVERDEIVAGALVLRRAVGHLPPRLGHLAYIPRGPVLDWSRQDDDERARLADVFFSRLLPFLRARGAVALHVELPLVEDDGQCMMARERLSAFGFRPVRAVQPARTIVLDLKEDEDRLLANMKEKWRYNIRLAGRKGVQVRAAAGGEDVRAWYRLLQITGQRDSFGIHSYEYYWRAWRIFVPRGQGQLLLAEYEGEVLAGIFVGCMARQALYLYGASSNENRNVMPNYLLQWEAIRWARARGATLYDFWGIPETDDAGEALAGVYRFKSGWGGQIVRFAGNYEYVFRPVAMGLARRFLS